MGTQSSSSSELPLLLYSKQQENSFIYNIIKPSLLLNSTKWLLKFAMWFTFVSWVTLIFIPSPSNSVRKLYIILIDVASANNLLGITGGIFMVHGGPLIIISFLAIFYLSIPADQKEQQIQQLKKKKSASFRLWTFPVVVDGAAFGVVTAAELIGILLFVVYIVWAITAFTIENIGLLPVFHLTHTSERFLKLLELNGLRCAFIGLMCMTFLFLPVGRGSILLRLTSIPFEHAIRYHVWLGHLTMTIFTIHGLSYMVAWAIEGRLIQEVTGWDNMGVSNLPGVITEIAGVLMWVTSLPQVRRLNFELFYYTHQLYIIFVFFFAMHAGHLFFSMVAAGIFLFMLDRFLRFFQSQKTVDILSAKCLPSGSLELVISKPQWLEYNALGWVFIRIQELPWLQWHPFSVSSSPLDGKHHLTILIKVLGDWTQKLNTHMRLQYPNNLSLKASVEGPYGHELPYHLTYENLILVAGGIGISPFLAILKDILHRIRDSKPCMPRNILLVWAVKNSDELPLLHSLDMSSLCPCFHNLLNLEIQTYVTRESKPQLKGGGNAREKKNVSSSSFVFPAAATPATSAGMMSSLVGTGNIIWVGLYLVVSTVGLAVSHALLNVFYINPYNVTHWWYKGIMLLGCMLASVILFGGFVIGLWHIWDVKAAAAARKNNTEYYGQQRIRGGFNHHDDHESDSSNEEDFFNNIKYGERPNFKEIFGSMAERWGNIDIGVMVCGPTTLQTSIAKECRSKNFTRMGAPNEPVFHFNNHSFDL